MFKRTFVGLMLIGLLGLMLIPQATQLIKAQSTTGTIAYVGNGNQIRLIEPDGSNDRPIWTAPAGDPQKPFTISSLDWRPDAGELAFASDHEQLYSVFEHDIYTILPDGSGLRKLTHGPTHDELATYPKGTVRITVRNDRGGGPYLVYVAGAPEPQTVGGGPGSSHTLTFTDVADFGPGRPQAAVAIFGLDRWFNSASVDVVAGQTAQASTLVISGNGLRNFGAFLPSWRSDAANVGFVQGCGAIKQVAANPLPGDFGVIAARPNAAGLTSSADWAPLPAQANQVLFSDLFLEGKLYRTTEGSTSTGEYFLSHPGGELLLDLQWLPDGSGFLYSLATDFNTDLQTWQTANIFVYNFAARTSTRLTNYAGSLARTASVAPDGQTIVFDLAKTLYGAADLWLMQRDGTNSRLLVNGGAYPVWSSRTPFVATPTPVPTSPTPIATSAPSVTSTTPNATATSQSVTATAPSTTATSQSATSTPPNDATSSPSATTGAATLTPTTTSNPAPTGTSGAAPVRLFLPFIRR